MYICPDVSALALVDGATSLLEEYWNETQYYKHIPFSAESSREFFINTVMSEDDLLLARVKDGEVVGILVAVSAPIFFNADAIVVDNLLTYVSKKHRGTMYGASMLREMERWAKWKGASTITISTISGINGERTSKLYASLGYAALGDACVKNLGGSSHE